MDMNLAQIGLLVQQRRQDLGLSQGRLAKLCGLSRATIHQLESGTLKDLGAAKLLAVMGLLGLQLNASPQPRPRDALKWVSQIASVSYKHSLSSQALAAAMVEGRLPESLAGHVATMLDEAPLALLVAAVEEVAAQSQRPAKTLWKHLVQWAHELQSPRPVWA